jgi:hypothetical protein
MLGASFVVLWAGCGHLEAFEPPDEHRGLTHLDDPEGDEGDAPADPFACVDDELGAELPLHLERWTDGEGNDVSPSCAEDDRGEDYVVSWIAPARGEYVFDLAGSAYDTTLVVADSCSGAELACDDDWLPGDLSQVVVDLVRDQRVIVMVDGRRNQAGDFVLNIEPLEAAEADCGDGRDLDADGRVDCEDRDCDGAVECPLPCADGVVVPPLPIVETGSTAVEADDTDPSCVSSSAAPDLAFQFTAPAAGTYRMSTEGSEFDTVLYVLDGCGPELACNDDAASGGLQSAVTVQLAAEQTVVVVVDGYGSNSGRVTLTVSRQ